MSAYGRRGQYCDGFVMFWLQETNSNKELLGRTEADTEGMQNFKRSARNYVFV